MGGNDELNVLICSDYLPPSDGGVEKVIDKLSAQLADRGIRVHLFTLRDEGHPVDVDERIDVHSVESLDLRQFIGLQSKLSLRAFPAVNQLLKQGNFDVIHLHNRFFYTTLVGHLVAMVRRVDTKIVTTFHLGAIDEIDGLGGIVARGYEQSVCRAIAKCSDEVVGVSEAAATHASALGADAESVHIVPNGVDPATFRPPNERPVTDKILFVGRLVRNKGPQDFLSALPSVFDRNDDVEAELVGTGPMREQLVSMADELDIAERVHFRGRVPDVAEVMRGSTIFCRPSYSEGMPLTLLEAMATGVPPVVTPVAGVPEVVDDGENGLLVPEGDTEALAAALTKLCDHPEQRLALGSAAREYVCRNHNWSARTDRLLDIYRDETD